MDIPPPQAVQPAPELADPPDGQQPIAVPSCQGTAGGGVDCVRWSRVEPRIGEANVVSGEGTVVVAGFGRVTAYDAVGGQLLWTERGRPSEPDVLSQPRDGVVAVGSSGRGDGTSLRSLATGESIWRRAELRSRQLRVEDDIVVVREGASTIGLDRDAGGERWRLRPDGPGRASALLPGGVLRFSPDDAVAQLFGYRDRRQRWIHALPRGSRLVHGGLERVIVDVGRGRLAALDAATGDELWRTRRAPMTTGRTAADGDLVVTAVLDGGARFTAFDAATGRQRWQHAAGHVSAVKRRPVLLEDLILITEARPFPALVALDRVHGTVVWTTGFRQAPTSQRIVQLGNMIVVPGDERVVALDAADGSKRWSVPVPDARVVHRDPLVLAGGGRLVAIDVPPADAGSPRRDVAPSRPRATAAGGAPTGRGPAVTSRPRRPSRFVQPPGWVTPSAASW